MAPPEASVRPAASNMRVFSTVAVPVSWRRTTGMAPTIRRKGPISGLEKSGALASGRSRRGMTARSSMPSTSAFW